MLASCLALVTAGGTGARATAPAAAPARATAPAAAPARATAPARAAAAVPRPTGWLHTRGSVILDSTGARFTIKAVNWFGLETADCAPHGLWAVSMAHVLDQIRDFGFNTVRVPFADQCLAPDAVARSVDYERNPALRGRSPLRILDALVAGARARGLRIVLDRHRPGYDSQSALWYTAAYPESRWIRDWTMLARRYAANPAVVGADLHNEPHGAACWGCGVRSRDWAAAAVRAGNAVLRADPHLLVIVEGVERQGDGSLTWWGGGLADVARHPLTLRVPHRLVYSVHDYPASVYPQRWFSAPDYPADLARIWTTNFGYLQRSGRAPVLLGEFGSRLQTRSDRQWMTTLVRYLAANRMSFGYWSYNPDSGDTGGLVAGDWRTPEAARLRALRPLLARPVTTPPRITPPRPAATPG